jgi:predicted PurR-regulated permease PerM
MSKSRPPSADTRADGSPVDGAADGFADAAEEGHPDLVAQPHDGDDEGPIAEAEAQAAAISTDEEPLGRPGRPLDRRSPFMIGLTAAFGVAVTVLLVELIITARDVLVLIGLALFIAVGLEPAVSWLARRMPRWAAVVVVFLVLLGVIAGFLATAIPTLVSQATAFAAQVPGYLQDLQNSNTFLGGLNAQFHIQDTLTQALNGGGLDLVGGLLGAGEVVLDVLSSTLVVLVLVVYFLADLPRLRRGMYRLVPSSRRPRAILIGDQIFTKVGSYVLGNVVISVIAGVLALAWLLIFHVPYPLLLAVLVALLDVVPVVGTTVAGVVVTLVALTVSVPVALGTAGFFVAYRFLEDYLLVPRIIGRAVRIPGLVTVVAVLLGGVLLGVIGAVVAIPIAAAILLIVQEVVLPRLDRT